LGYFLRVLMENDRRRTFRGILILALGFRIISFLIIGLATLLAIGAVVVALTSGQLDAFASIMAGAGGAIAYGVGLFLGSEMIRLLVGIAKDLRRISESTAGGVFKVTEAEPRSATPPPAAQP
jgi:hypothetical protein